MKPWWVIALVLALVILSFFTGRLTAPKPAAEVVERWRTEYITLPPPPPVTVSVPVTVGRVDSGAVHALLDTVANRDSLIMELYKERFAEVPFETVYYYPSHIPEKLSSDVIDIRGLVSVWDCIQNGEMRVEVFLDTLNIPFVSHDSTAVVVVPSTTPWTTYALIGVGGAIIGAITYGTIVH